MPKQVRYLNLRSNDETSWNMNVFTTYSLRWTLGDLNINIIHKNRYQVLLNWFQPYQTPMWGKQQIFLYPCAVTVIILSKYLVGLNYRIFLFRTLCWSSYEDEVLYQHFTWRKLRVRSSVVYSVSVSCCNNDNSGPHGGGGV